MKKTVKIVILVFFVFILLLGTAAFVFLKTYNIDQYRAYLARYIGSALGREVRIQGLQLGIAADKGIILNVQGVSILDDPAFSAGPFLTAASVYLDVNIFDFLIRKKIHISRAEIRSPALQLIRTAEGKINLPELSMPSGKSPAPRAEPKGTADMPVGLHLPFSSVVYAAQAEEEGGRDAPLEFFIQAFRIEDGSLTFTDQGYDPPWVIPVEGIDFQITDLSLKRPSAFRFNCSVWADQANIRGRGNLFLDLDNQQVHMSDFKVETDLARLQIRKAPFYALLRENLRLEGNPEGKLQVTVPQLKAGPTGLLDLSAEGQLTDGKVKVEMLQKPFEGIQVAFQMTESDLDIKTLSFFYGAGKVAGQGRVEDYLRERAFFYDLHIEDIQLAELIPSRVMPVLEEGAGPVILAGKLLGDFSGEGQGQEPEDSVSLTASWKGEGAFEVREGKFSNVNLLRFVLDKISFIPHLVSQIEADLPERYKDILKKEETTLDLVELSVKMQDDTIFVPKAAFGADGFLMTANGQMDFAQNLVLKADFYILEDLSAGMVMAVEEFAYLQDEDNRIHIPLMPYQGRFRDLRIYPDVGDVGRQVIRSKGREELKKVIFRALDIEEESSNADAQGEPSQIQESGQPSSDSQEKDVRPEEAVINGILDAIFKGDQPF